MLDYILMFVTIFPIISLTGFLAKRDNRLLLIENPLIIIYFLAAFGYFYIYWFEQQILLDYVKVNNAMARIFYGILALAPIFQKELPN